MSEPKIETHPEVDLTNVISDSKAQLAEVAPIKRGRGRPRKDSHTTPPPPTAAAPASGGESQPPIASLVPVLVPALKAISTIPAAKYRVKELALSDEEATPLAQAVDQLITAYAPDLSAMSPKTAAWLSFGMVASSLFIAKMQVYYVAEKIETPSEPAEKSAGPRVVPTEPNTDQGYPKPQGGGVLLSSDDYFKRPR